MTKTDSDGRLSDGSFDSTLNVLERARDGDRTAVSILVERALPDVRRWAHGRMPRMARGAADTEDVVQDAVFATLKRLRKFRHQTVGALQAYLRTAVVNRIRDLIRRSRVRGVSVEIADNVPDTRRSPIESGILNERIEDFLNALQRLGPADRQLIIWRVELGYSVEEIARRVGKTRAAAAMSVSRALGRLQQHLNAKSK